MVQQRSDTGVRRLGAESTEAAVEVLATSFSHYPMTRHFFPGGDYEAKLRALFRVSCECRMILGWPLLGTFEADSLVAVACVSVPDHRPDPPELEEAERRFLDRIGPQAAARVEQYSQQKAAHLPPRPHLYLAAVGVDPRHQGCGHGGTLIRCVQALSAAHPLSTGVALDTQSGMNVSLYEHLGYHLTAWTHVGDVPMFCMFRPNDAPEQAH